jgi:chemotaxis protein MotA
MDILSLLGIIIAFIALLGGNFLEGGALQSLINLPAALIVFGGTIGAALLQTPMMTLKRALHLFSWVFKPPIVNYAHQIKEISQWAAIARHSGLLGLEKIAQKEPDIFAKKALSLLIDGADAQSIRRILEADITLGEQRDINAAKVYAGMGGYAPTIGIIGAVMGLIYVMRNLGDPSELGAGIAVAFVATIYGVAFANLLLLPIANKLILYVNQQSQLKELIVEGVLYVADGENPKSVEMKLSGYL